MDLEEGGEGHRPVGGGHDEGSRGGGGDVEEEKGKRKRERERGPRYDFVRD